MHDETKLHLTTAINGLMYSGELINEALLGRKKHFDYTKCLNGPFAQALMRVAEITDGAPVTDMEAARKDMLYLFEFLDFLRGGFHDSAWTIMKEAHAIVADRISASEASRILGTPEFMLDLEVRLGYLHSFADPANALEISYARYEVLALKAKYERMKRYAMESKESGND